MPRSASTWMYNVTRILLEKKYPGQVSAGWIKDYKELDKKPIMLIKIHQYDAGLARRAQTILYSYRDIRDAFASCIRKFGVKTTINFPRRLIYDDTHWKTDAHCIMKYEDFVSDQAVEIQKIAKTLEVTNYTVEDILQEIKNLKKSASAEDKPHDKQSLFHENHATTKGGHGNWENEVNGELLQQIETEFKDWFTEHQYTITQ